MEINATVVCGSFVDLEVSVCGSTVCEEVTNLAGRVPDGLIENLENVLKTLKDFNKSKDETVEAVSNITYTYIEK